MLQNYLKITLRNLFRNKISSFINIGGLAAGMAVAMLNGLWIWDELSFNQYHENYNHIAQVAYKGVDKEGPYINNTLQYPLSIELQTNYNQQFKHLVTASWVQDYVLAVDDKKLSATGQFMEPGALEMLTLEMVYGNWSGLKEINSIVLSESIAKALFGNMDPVNQIVKINNKLNITVTGVYKDLPLNSQFHELNFISTFDLWLSENTWIKERASHDWENHFLKIYAEILPNSSFEQVSATIKDAMLKNIGDHKELKARNPQVFLYPMQKWHLYDINRGEPDTAPIRMVWLVGIIGAFVLLLACINFMNLSTARSEKRAKEVGIRKAIGSARRQLIGQFFSESFLTVTFAFIMAIVLIELLLPWFNHIANKEISILWTNPVFWLAGLSFTLLTGLIAGSYPALYLSAFQPVKVLKGTFRVGRLASVPRKVLVVFQFVVSVVLIISTIIVYQQIQYAKNRSVGYDRAGLITMEMKSPDFYGKYDVLRNELLNTGVVTEMSESMGKVTEVASGNNGFSWKGKDANLEESFGTLTVTHDHGRTVGWQFVQGRDFSRDLASDSSGMVINEAAAKYMGLQNPVGETVSWKWWRDGRVKYYTILGVVKDMVMESPFDAIEPTLFYIKGFNGDVNWINIRINPNVSASQALPKIEEVFKKLIPSAPFDYIFVDGEYATKFAAEERIGKLASFFAILAIFISCLGLFGLASFVAEQRTKEIGIRKVLGASVLNLWQLLSKDFIILVMISLVIATPLAYYFMNSWIQNYTYRADISWWIFASAGLGALLIALLTVSFQAIRAAVANPVESLKNE